MNLRKIEKDIEDEVKADYAAVINNDNSGRLVERHINGISFGLWTLIALFILAASFAIWHHTKEKREHERKQPQVHSSAPASSTQ